MEKKFVTSLESYKDNNYVYEGVDKLALTKELLTYIGHENSYIRDNLVYPNLAHLLHDNHFNADELTVFLRTLISDKYMLFDMDNKIENSVLKRSFSLLQIAILVYVHNRDNNLDIEDIKDAYIKFIQYFKEETIFEGYNPKVGWLHSVAHSADVMSQFMLVKSFGSTEIEEMFNCIATRFRNQKELYCHDEDERMVVALVNGLNRDILSQEFILNWLDNLSTYEKNGQYPNIMYLTNNIKHLLRSLYFSFLDNEKYDYLTGKIKLVLKENVKQR